MKQTPSLPLLSDNRYLIDTHCHLDMDSYNDDLNGVIENAQRHNVPQIITIGIDIPSSIRAIKIAQKTIYW